MFTSRTGWYCGHKILVTFSELRPACTCSSLPAPGAQSWRQGIATETRDQDAITDVFSTLIDPATSTLGTARHGRSKLRLEGLRKFEPQSVEHGHVDMDEADGPPGSAHAGRDLSPDIEVDAPNFPGKLPRLYV